MAQDIVSGLFGLSPYQVEQQQRNQINQDAARFAQMPAVQRGVMGLYQGGAGLAGIGAGMMGMVNPEVEQAKAREAALSGLDMSSPKSIRERAAQIADPQIKMRLVLMANQMEKEQADLELTRSHAKYYEQGGANKGGTELSRLVSQVPLSRRAAEAMAYNLGKNTDEIKAAGDSAVAQAIIDYERLVGPLEPKIKRDLIEGKTMLGAEVAPVAPAPAAAVAPPITSSPVAQAQRPSGFPSVSGPEQIKRDEERIAIIESEIAAKPNDPNTPALRAELENTRKRIEKLRSLSPAAQQSTSPRNKIEAEGAVAEAKAGYTEQYKSDRERWDTVRKTPEALVKVDQLITQLSKGDVNTGIAADLRTMLDKLTAALGGKDAAKRATDTEIANAMMGSDVFSLIQSLGIGARGMDTPAEREFLRDVLSGRVALEKGTLLRMAQLRKEALEREAQSWNDDIDRGRISKKLSESQYKIALPKLQVTTPEAMLTGEDKKALDWANANPNDPRAARIKQKLGVK